VSEGSPGVLKTYTNGILAGQRNHVLPVTNAFRFEIGGGGVFDIARNFFLGQIDEVAVFDRALTADQIGAQYFSTVAQAPIITRQPVGTNLFAGGTIRLSVGVVGSPPLIYQWFNFTDLVPGQTNATLIIPNATTTDSGSYSVTITNLFGTATSDFVDVTVMPAVPPQITQDPVSVTRYAGARATFTVAATGGGTLRFQWQTNDVNVPNQTNTTFTINNVQAANAGNYRVVVTNEFGSATSTTARSGLRSTCAPTSSR